MRGKRSFDKLLNDKNETPLIDNSTQGRSKKLLQLRNVVLFHRYYYYVKIQRQTYLNTLKSLEDEFFICQRTIIDILTKGSEEIDVIAKKKLSVNQLIEKFNYLKWKNK